VFFNNISQKGGVMSDDQVSAQSQAIETLYKKDNVIVLESCGLSATIQRVRVQDLGKIMGLANSFIQELGMTADGKVTLDLQNSGMLLKLISKLPNEVAEICGTLSSVPLDVVRVLELDDGLQLLKAVIEVNKSFFSQKVKPKLDAVLTTVGMSTPTTSLPA
jgi:hypothetical protein